MASKSVFEGLRFDPDDLLPAPMSDDESLPHEAGFVALQQGAICVPDSYAYDPPLPAWERHPEQQSQESQVR